MQKLVFMLLLAGVVSMALAPIAYSEVNVSEHPDNTKKLAPKSFGQKTKDRVCGDKLCDTIDISDTLTVVLSNLT